MYDMIKIGQLVKLGYERQPYEDTGIVLTAPEINDNYGPFVTVHWQRGGTQAEFEHDLVPYDPEKAEFIISVEFQQGCM